MKSTIAAALIALVFSTTAARAQEESATPNEKLSLRATDPSETEPTVSVPSERSSEDYPRPGTPLVTPTPKAAPTASTSKSTGRSSASPAASPKASPSPAVAATTSTPKGAEPAIRAAENKWLGALQTHDSAVVQTLVADNYIGVTATGRYVTKPALLADIKKDKNNYESATNTRMEVRVHGDTGVVVGTTRQVGKDAEGKQFTYYYRWTDTWALKNGQWLCIASQSIQVPK